MTTPQDPSGPTAEERYEKRHAAEIAHDDDLAARCDRRLVMQDGMIVDEQTGARA